MTVSGVDFIALQVRDLERAAAFYETRLGLTRNPAGPPHAVVFDTKPIAFAVREPLPGLELPANPGAGVVLWFQADDAQRLHDEMSEAGVPIVAAPIDGPFGRTFSFSDPDGYVVTIHSR
jgi:predicted enzyme related to lactoylglutathione lyase